MKLVNSTQKDIERIQIPKGLPPILFWFGSNWICAHFFHVKSNWFLLTLRLALYNVACWYQKKFSDMFVFSSVMKKSTCPVFDSVSQLLFYIRWRLVAIRQLISYTENLIKRQKSWKSATYKNVKQVKVRYIITIIIIIKHKEIPVKKSGIFI